MRAYGPGLVELLLEDLATAIGWLMLALALATGLAAGAFGIGGVDGGLLVAATAASGLLLVTAGAALRQNRSAMDLGVGLSGLAGVGWLLTGALAPAAGAVGVGAALLVALAVLLVVRRRAVRTRFAPRFFSTRQLETLVHVVEAMIDGDGDEVVHPIEAAVRVDHLAARLDGPVVDDLRRVLVVTEWVLPLVIGRPLPFSALGSHERRRAIARVVGARGPFRDLARGLRTMAVVGYYGDPRALAQVGYVPFEQRRRGLGVDDSPRAHPDPFAQERS